MTESQTPVTGDRLRVTFETTVEAVGLVPLIRPTPGGPSFGLDCIPGLTYEVIAPEIKPLDVIDARWLDGLPFGSIVLCMDNDTEWPWMKAKGTVNSERPWVRMWSIDTFVKPHPSSRFRVLRVGWRFEE